MPRIVILATIALALSPPSARAQASWRVTSSPAVDRWFAAMARLDLPTPGELFFYMKASLPPPSWRAEAARTSAVDVLHFVPLYFPSGTPASLAAAVRAAALGQPAPTPRASFLVGALEHTFATTNDRRLLELVGALADSARGPASVPSDRLAALQATWDSAYAPALATFLAARRLDGGELFVSPSLGAEGRIFEGRPDDRRDNIIAVGTAPASALDEAPLLAAVRESCSLLITELSAIRHAWGDDPIAASRAAVRCGAALIDRALPSRSAAYRALWSHLAGGRRYADAFPPVPDEDAAIAAAVQRALGTHPAPRSSPPHT